jgi:hypothetical protein
LLADDRQNGRGAQIKPVEEEIVWVDRLQTQRIEHSRRKVRQVRGDDGVRATSNSCGHDMPVVFVGQRDPCCEFLPPSDQSVIEGYAHRGERSRVSASETGTSTHASSTAVDRGISAVILLPATFLADALEGGPVILSGVGVETGLAGIPGHFSQGCTPVLTHTLAVSKNVRKEDPAMPARLLKWNLSFLQEFDQSGPANPKKVGGLLSREPLRVRDEGDDLSLAHCIYYIRQKVVDLLGQRDLFSVRPQEQPRPGTFIR